MENLRINIAAEVVKGPHTAGTNMPAYISTCYERLEVNQGSIVMIPANEGHLLN